MRLALPTLLCALLLACDPHGNLPNEGEALQRAMAAARAEAGVWLEALEAFRQDFGRYPSGLEGLGILVSNPDRERYPDWHGPYGRAASISLRDPWDRPYRLESTDQTLSVTSDGRDRRPHTGDEVVVSVGVRYYP